VEELVESTRLKVFDLLRQNIKPEFLNRIDEVIVFTPLFKDDIKQIVNLQFKQIQNRLANSRLKITITDAAIDWLAAQGYNPTFGARPLKRLLQKSILNELSKALIAEQVKPDDQILIDMQDGNLVFTNK
jgi:ATP-dependent Clp protease ATP-binding subunit ClpB